MVFLSIDIVTVNSDLNEGARYSYTVVCTDECGFDIWDNSKLPANLFIEIKAYKPNHVTIFTSFNLTIAVNNSINTDANIFNFTEHFDPITRENLERPERYSWQWINEFDNYINISVPAIFLVHAPASYINNTYLLQKSSVFENLEVSNEVIQTQKYVGTWEDNLTRDPPSIRILSHLITYFEFNTGFLIRMELEMFEVRSSSDYKTKIIDPIGSFKMTRKFQIINTNGIDLMIIFSLFAILILTRGKRRGIKTSNSY